jgi:uncharacterized protein YybS (DUF2232 family)
LSKGRSFALIWCIINALMLLSFITPLVVITINFVLVPALALFTKLEWKKAALFYAISLAAVGAVTGYLGLFPVSVSVFFLAPSIVMGIMYRKKLPARSAIVGGTVTLLAQMLLGLLITYAAGLDPIEKVREFIQSGVDSLPEVLRNSVNQAALNATIHYFLQIIPLLLIVTAVFYTFIGHAVGRWILRKNNVMVPGLKPVREWMLPRSMALYLVIVTIADMFISIESNTFISMVVWNLLPILSIAFTVQAISFFFFFAHAKKKSVALPVFSIVMVVLFPPLLIYLYCVIGLLDVLTPMRKRIAGG